MNKLKLDILDTFYIDEYKCGFHISKDVKRLWAVELDLLKEFIRVCNKYHLKYYAIGGTLLGAIRHKGFIPWDDDIDVAMPRKDYVKLQQISKTEFTPPYFFQDEYTDPGALFGHAKLRNSSTTIISPGYIDPKHGDVCINAGVFIDIFPMDNMPDDKEERSLWLNEIKEYAVKAWTIRKYTHRHIPSHDESIEEEVRTLTENGTPHYWFEQYDNVLSRYSDTPTKETCLYCLYLRYGDRWSYNSSEFQQTIKVPFEMTEIMVPAQYKSILEKCYGDWNVMKQIGSLHSGINESFVDLDHPWNVYVDPVTGIKRDLIISLRKN